MKRAVFGAAGSHDMGGRFAEGKSSRF